VSGAAAEFTGGTKTVYKTRPTLGWGFKTHAKQTSTWGAAFAGLLTLVFFALGGVMLGVTLVVWAFEAPTRGVFSLLGRSASTGWSSPTAEPMRQKVESVGQSFDAFGQEVGRRADLLGQKIGTKVGQKVDDLGLNTPIGTALSGRSKVAHTSPVAARAWRSGTILPGVADPNTSAAEPATQPVEFVTSPATPSPVLSSMLDPDSIVAPTEVVAPVASPLPEPGWYIDPSRPEGKRWWNGQTWTEHAQ
jgi:hypothetical protein